MQYRLSQHLVTQANAKNIPLPVVEMVLHDFSQTRFISTMNHDKCNKCATPKTRVTGVTNYKGTRHAIDVVVCDRCSLAITVHVSNYSAVTPIRADQPEVKYFIRYCPECNKPFRVTARTWEKLSEQTMHGCKNGVRTDLISDEHRNMKGKYYLPKKGK